MGRRWPLSAMWGASSVWNTPVGHVIYETDGWISHMRVSPKGGQVAFLDHTTHDDDRGVVSVVDLAGQEEGSFDRVGK